jgi:hypothetical protein
MSNVPDGYTVSHLIAGPHAQEVGRMAREYCRDVKIQVNDEYCFVYSLSESGEGLDSFVQGFVDGVLVLMGKSRGDEAQIHPDPNWPGIDFDNLGEIQ